MSLKMLNLLQFIKDVKSVKNKREIYEKIGLSEPLLVRGKRS